MTDFNEAPYDESCCGKPCPPSQPCSVCADYWDRMVREGLWDEKLGQWIDAGMREMLK